jgi:hypothetical protein
VLHFDRFCIECFVDCTECFWHSVHSHFGSELLCFQPIDVWHQRRKDIHHLHHCVEYSSCLIGGYLNFWTFFLLPRAHRYQPPPIFAVFMVIFLPKPYIAMFFCFTWRTRPSEKGGLTGLCCIADVPLTISVWAIPIFLFFFVYTSIYLFKHKHISSLYVLF